MHIYKLRKVTRCKHSYIIYTIILLKSAYLSVDVSKLHVVILARSSWEMYQTVLIDSTSRFLSRVRVAVRPSSF